MRKTPAVKPNWSKATEQVLNLSGQTIAFSLPGGSSKDFPDHFKTSLNLYDPELYGDWKMHTIMKTWWDYQKKRLFITDMLGTLELKMNIYHIGNDHDDIFQVASLQRAVLSILREIYPGEHAAKHRLPKMFETFAIADNRWLKYLVKGKNANSDNHSFAIPLTKSHYLVVSFRIIQSKEPTESNWYQAAQNDIEKIIQSFKVSYTDSVLN